LLIFGHYRQRPGNKVSKRYPTMQSGHLTWFFSREIVPVARRVWRGFCQSWQELVKLFEYRGTMPISGRELIPVQSCFKRALARSRYEHSKFVLGAEAKAKTMTSLFTLLSVLGFRAIFFGIYL
jgi:hypothetical protein